MQRIFKKQCNGLLEQRIFHFLKGRFCSDFDESKAVLLH